MPIRTSWTTVQQNVLLTGVYHIGIKIVSLTLYKK